MNIPDSELDSRLNFSLLRAVTEMDKGKDHEFGFPDLTMNVMAVLHDRRVNDEVVALALNAYDFDGFLQALSSINQFLSLDNFSKAYPDGTVYVTYFDKDTKAIVCSLPFAYSDPVVPHQYVAVELGDFSQKNKIRKYVFKTFTDAGSEAWKGLIRKVHLTAYDMLDELPAMRIHTYVRELGTHKEVMLSSGSHKGKFNGRGTY